MKPNSSRMALATVMTAVVVTLLLLAVASDNRTQGYFLFAKENHAQDANEADGDDEAEFGEDVAHRLNIPRLTMPARIRLTLHAGPPNADPVQIPVLHRAGGPNDTTASERLDDLRKTPPTHGREVALECSAVLFSLFGLFVLWWGRDRASLWLGLFCASFAPSIFDSYGVLPEFGMLLASIVADALFYVSIYAFFEIARTFALEAVDEHDPLRGWIDRAREVALMVLLLPAIINFLETVGPAIFSARLPDALVTVGNVSAELAKAGVLCLGPIVLLAIGLWRAVDGSVRKRVSVALLTTLLAESGVIYSIGGAWSAHYFSGFDNYWFSLLAIPIGFLVSIPAYKVIEVKFVLNRIFVFTAMTAIIAGAITFSETWADEAMKDMLPEMILHWFDPAKPNDLEKGTVATMLRFSVAFVIVLSFSRCHDALNEFFKALFFRRRDDAVKSLRDFSVNRAPIITSREEMLQQAIMLVCGSIGARGSAFYEEAGAGFALATSHGEMTWPRTVGENDPAFTLLRGGRRRVNLEALHPTPSELGDEGVAIRMAVSNRVIGSLVVVGRMKESEGPYEHEELDVLEDVARSIADALFNLRANETADFVRGVADGTIEGAEAKQKAAALCDMGLPGVDASLRRPAARPTATRPVPAPSPAPRRAPLLRDETLGIARLPSLDAEPVRADQA